MKKIISALVLLVSLLLLVSCSSPTEPVTSNEDNDNVVVDSETNGPLEFYVNINGPTVLQSQVDVLVGDTVIWDSNAQDFEGNNLDCNLVFESGEALGYLPFGGSVAYTFTVPGEYYYYCQELDAISGTVIVE